MSPACAVLIPATAPARSRPAWTHAARTVPTALMTAVTTAAAIAGPMASPFHAVPDGFHWIVAIGIHYREASRRIPRTRPLAKPVPDRPTPSAPGNNNGAEAPVAVSRRPGNAFTAPGDGHRRHHGDDHDRDRGDDHDLHHDVRHAADDRARGHHVEAQNSGAPITRAWRPIISLAAQQPGRGPSGPWPWAAVIIGAARVLSGSGLRLVTPTVPLDPASRADRRNQPRSRRESRR